MNLTTSSAGFKFFIAALLFLWLIFTTSITFRYFSITDTTPKSIRSNLEASIEIDNFIETVAQQLPHAPSNLHEHIGNVLNNPNNIHPNLQKLQTNSKNNNNNNNNNPIPNLISNSIANKNSNSNSNVNEKFELECDPPFMPTKNLHTCSVNYKNDTRYLPSIEVLKPYLKSNAQEYFREIQFPNDCNSIDYHLISLPHFGVGSSIKHASKMFGAHWSRNIGVLHGNAQWRYGDGLCHNKSMAWSCFLSPLSHCPLNDKVIAWVYNKSMFYLFCHFHCNMIDCVYVCDL